MALETNGGSVAHRYGQLESEKHSFLMRGRNCAELTIPTLLPPDGHSSATVYQTPYQAIGARGVNNLASKLLLAILPPNAPFFRLTVDSSDLKGIAETEVAKGKVDAALAKLERIATQDIENSALRVPIFEALKQLIVAGNALLYMPKEGGMRVFRLDRFVVKRDAMGNLMEIITKETISPSMLPDATRAQMNNGDSKVEHKQVDLFTYICRKDKKWYVYQEVEGIKIMGSEGEYPEDNLPWLALRMIRIDGESYGRSYVEEFIGDLKSLEALTKAIVEGSAASAKVLFLVKPNGTTKHRVLAQSPNGAIVTGDANDVSVLQVQKAADFRVAMETMKEIAERLAFAFLLNSAVQRNGERVTAEEIRFMAQELESALGGIYSILSQELQLPLVRLVISKLEKQGKMPKFPKGALKPQVITGMEALGRGQDLNKLAQFLQMLQPLSPQYIAENVNLNDYVDRLAASLGIDTEGLIKSPEQKAQEQAQAQQMQQQMMMQQTMAGMAEKASPALAKGVMDNMQMQGDE